MFSVECHIQCFLRKKVLKRANFIHCHLMLFGQKRICFTFKDIKMSNTILFTKHFRFSKVKSYVTKGKTSISCKCVIVYHERLYLSHTMWQQFKANCVNNTILRWILEFSIFRVIVILIKFDGLIIFKRAISLIKTKYSNTELFFV